MLNEWTEEGTTEYAAPCVLLLGGFDGLHAGHKKLLDRAKAYGLPVGVMTILGTLLFMLTLSVPITLVVVLITPVSLLVANFIAKRTYDMFRLQSQVRGEQTGFVEEMVQGQKVVQAFGRERDSLEKFDEINERLRKCSLRAIFFSSITNPSTRFVNSLVYTGVGIVGALSVVSGGAGDNAFGFFLIGKHSDFVSGTPELERAGVLQIFWLQVQLAFRGDAVCLGQGGGADDILQHQRGVEQFVDRDHMVFLSFQNGSKKPCLFHKL